MCLITEQKKAKIAKKDIEVYKELEIYSGRIISRVQKFQYMIEKKILY